MARNYASHSTDARAGAASRSSGCSGRQKLSNNVDEKGYRMSVETESSLAVRSITVADGSSSSVSRGAPPPCPPLRLLLLDPAGI